MTTMTEQKGNLEQAAIIFEQAQEFKDDERDAFLDRPRKFVVDDE